jgi:DNA-binding beta-propeller fold protein YncE
VKARFDGGSADGRFQQPVGVALEPGGGLDVTDFGRGVVERLSPAGEVQATFGSLEAPGSNIGGAEPEAIQRDAGGNLYVSDEAGGSVDKLAPSGQVVARWQGAGGAPFRDPTGLALDSQGDVYVTDLLAGTVQKLSPSGQALATWR